MKSRLSVLLCLAVLLFPGFSFAQNKTESIPLPEHQFLREEGVIIEQGIRAVQDFEVAHSLNEELIAWLYGGALSNGFPVMSGTNDYYYENHTFQGKARNGYGCVCLKEDFSTDFSENTLFLFGETGKNAPFSIFSKLTEQNNFEASPFFRLLTPQGDYQLDIFAILHKTALSDEELTAPTNPSGFQEWLSGILESSTIQCDQEALPRFGEKIIVLSNSSPKNRKVIILASFRPISYETKESYFLNKWELDHASGTSHAVNAGELGEKWLYSQKDPLWSQMRFESAMTPKYRIMSGGACGPCALANILVNILEPEELTALGKNCPTGFGALFCSCSVNLLYCNHSHIPYHLTSAEEYVRYLPVILCNFATGNNPYGVQSRWPYGSGTNTIYVPYVCQALSLNCVDVNNLQEGIEMVRNSGNRGALLCCALESSPFSLPGSTHFVAIIGVDQEDYVYVLDSLEKQNYKGRGKVAETVVPGLGRFHVKYSNGVALSPCFYIEKTEASENSL